MRVTKQMMRIEVLLTVLALVVAFTGACAVSSASTPATVLLGSKVPLPNDITIVPPGPEIPPELARFSGEWSGTWQFSGNLREHILVVEKLNRSGAQVVYAWSQTSLGSGYPGWGRYMAAFVDGALKLSFPRLRAVITYRMNADGTISARREEPGVVSTATLVRRSER